MYEQFNYSSYKCTFHEQNIWKGLLNISSTALYGNSKIIKMQDIP